MASHCSICISIAVLQVVQGKSPVLPEWISKVPVEFRTKNEDRVIRRYVDSDMHKCTDSSDPFKPKGVCLDRELDEDWEEQELEDWSGICGRCDLKWIGTKAMTYTRFCEDQPGKNVRVQYVEYEDDNCQKPNEWDFSDTQYVYPLHLKCQSTGQKSCAAYCDGPEGSRYHRGCGYRFKNDKEACLQDELCNWVDQYPSNIYFDLQYHTISSRTGVTSATNQTMAIV